MLMAGLVTAGMGCAVNPIVAHGSVTANQYFGDVGITGNGNSTTILRGSKVSKLSIIGDNNTVTVEDDVTIYRIEFWGKGNSVSIPETLSVRCNNVGNNQIIRRPVAVRPLPVETRYEHPSPVYTPPAEPAPANPAAGKPAAQAQPATLPPEADLTEEASPPEIEEK